MQHMSTASPVLLLVEQIAPPAPQNPIAWNSIDVSSAAIRIQPASSRHQNAPRKVPERFPGWTDSLHPNARRANEIIGKSDD